MTSDLAVGSASNEWQIRGDELVIIAGTCTSCGACFFPAPSTCPTCWATEFSPTDLTDGVTYALSVVDVMPAGYESPATVGYVDYAQDVRVFGHFSDVSGPPRAGAPVIADVAQVGTRRDGTSITAFRFRNSDKTGGNR